MSLFLKHPHLFANAEFKYKVMKRDPVTFAYWNFPKRKWRENPEHFGLKLVARPISDMTDDEIYSLSIIERIFVRKEDCNDAQDMREYIANRANRGILMFDDATDLLSLGVYPGPQDDENVIFINT